MSRYLCITVTFLDQMFHGRSDGGEPEWPPSPLRLFQALVAAASLRFRGDAAAKQPLEVLQWLERLAPPVVIAPTGQRGQVYRLYCPDNIGDRVASSWSRGGDASIADSRTEKDVHPTHLLDGSQVHYLWSLDSLEQSFVDQLRPIVRSVTHVGWGIDHVACDCRELGSAQISSLIGQHWLPGTTAGEKNLRCPKQGTLQALNSQYARFLRRIDRDERGNECFNPVPSLTTFDQVAYTQNGDAATLVHSVFLLQGDDAAPPFRYAQTKLIHISGMTRHVALEQLRQSPPRDVPNGWLESYVAGHAAPNGAPHQRFSYIPLPSIGHRHSDQLIRRMMVVAPAEAKPWLDHLTSLLSGQQLEPTKKTCQKMPHPPTLVAVRGDRVAGLYTRKAMVWHSVTPVILPGRNDHSPSKTRKLVRKALTQSGITQPCEFEFSRFSRFPKSPPAYSFKREKALSEIIRPDHLRDFSAIHLTLKFTRPILGPLLIGSGRHYGLGLFAAETRSFGG